MSKNSTEFCSARAQSLEAEVLEKERVISGLEQERDQAVADRDAAFRDRDQAFAALEERSKPMKELEAQLLPEKARNRDLLIHAGAVPMNYYQ